MESPYMSSDVSLDLLLRDHRVEFYDSVALVTNNKSTRVCLLNFVLGCMVIPIP
jgi:hypothetical protein